MSTKWWPHTVPAKYPAPTPSEPPLTSNFDAWCDRHPVMSYLLFVAGSIAAPVFLSERAGGHAWWLWLFPAFTIGLGALLLLMLLIASIEEALGDIGIRVATGVFIGGLLLWLAGIL